jgi:lipoyl(octanoyl) transferase
VAYVMVDLKRLYAPAAADLRDFIRRLEQWLIATLKGVDVEGHTIEGRTGVWVGVGEAAKKIAAIGVRVRHGVSYHGISLNLNPDLSHYAGIIPCGISDAGVTSLKMLGKEVEKQQLIECMQKEFVACIMNTRT